ncbi:MAG: hypothetical protein NT154_09015 [Verrucomicrobia bacterium]|nr:hypothetical protein [Verrucomicrobiota bacterium]
MSPQAGELLVNQVAPRIRALMPSFTPIGADDREEQVQDAVAIAVSLVNSTQVRGKKVSPGNISYYAVKLVKQGRRSTGLSKTDVMHPATQLAGRSHILSMDEPVVCDTESGCEMCLHDLLDAGAEDPAMAATRRLDWGQMVNALDPKTREVLQCLAAGDELTTLVPKLKRSRSALQFDKQRLAQLVREHLGEDVLARVQDRPRWRDNIDASRERAACRYERQAA